MIEIGEKFARMILGRLSKFRTRERARGVNKSAVGEEELVGRERRLEVDEIGGRDGAMVRQRHTTQLQSTTTTDDRHTPSLHKGSFSAASSTRHAATGQPGGGK